MIWKCVADADLMNESNALAQKLAVMPTKAIALTKDALNRGLNNSLDYVAADWSRVILHPHVAGRVTSYMHSYCYRFRLVSILIASDSDYVKALIVSGFSDYVNILIA